MKKKKTTVSFWKNWIVKTSKSIAKPVLLRMPKVVWYADGGWWLLNSAMDIH